MVTSARPLRPKSSTPMGAEAGPPLFTGRNRSPIRGGEGGGGSFVGRGGGRFHHPHKFIDESSIHGTNMSNKLPGIKSNMRGGNPWRWSAAEARQHQAEGAGGGGFRGRGRGMRGRGRGGFGFGGDRNMGDRGPSERGLGERGPGDRGPGDRGPGDRNAMDRGDDRGEDRGLDRGDRSADRAGADRGGDGALSGSRYSRSPPPTHHRSAFKRGSLRSRSRSGS